MHMLPLHVGWYLPLSTPSNKLALTTIPKNSRKTLPKNSQATRYPTLKLTQKLTTHNGLFGRRCGGGWHKEVVSAQGAAVGATVGIGRSFGG
jgi:hypothetical protein